MAEKKRKVNLTKSLIQLQEIVAWFEEQDNVDVELGLDKVREAAQLIKGSKIRLSQIQNEFKEIENEINEDITQKDYSDDSSDLKNTSF